jgi:hypothetical protein
LQTDRDRQLQRERTETDRETDRDLHTETDSYRQTDRDRQTVTDRQTETDRQRQTVTDLHRETECFWREMCFSMFFFISFVFLRLYVLRLALRLSVSPPSQSRLTYSSARLKTVWCFLFIFFRTLLGGSGLSPASSPSSSRTLCF